MDKPEPLTAHELTFLASITIISTGMLADDQACLTNGVAGERARQAELAEKLIALGRHQEHAESHGEPERYAPTDHERCLIQMALMTVAEESARSPALRATLVHLATLMIGGVRQES